MVTLTIEMIDGLRTPRGGYTDSTLKHFGLSNKTLKSGWIHRLVGQQVTDDAFAAATDGVMLRARDAKKLERNHSRPRSISLIGEVISFLSHHGINPCGFGYSRLASAVVLVSTGINREFSSKKAAKKYLRECRDSGVFLNTHKEKNTKTQNKEPKFQPRPSIDPKYSRNGYRAMLESREWMEMRVRVLLHHGRKCCLCGDGNAVIQVDHIVPASVDWSRRMDFSNLQVLCRPCNLGKGNRYSEDWRRT